MDCTPIPPHSLSFKDEEDEMGMLLILFLFLCDGGDGEEGKGGK